MKFICEDLIDNPVIACREIRLYYVTEKLYAYTSMLLPALLLGVERLDEYIW